MKFLKEKEKKKKKEEEKKQNRNRFRKISCTYRSILVSEDTTAQDLCRVINLLTPLCVSE